MKKIDKILSVINVIILGYLSLVTLFSILGVFNFGLGIGNVYYIFISVVATLMHIGLTVWFRTKKNDFAWFILIVIFGLICFYVTYNATVGRGSEYKWDGHIFFFK